MQKELMQKEETLCRKTRSCASYKYQRRAIEKCVFFPIRVEKNPQYIFTIKRILEYNKQGIGT